MSLAGHILHFWYSMLTSSGVLETPAAGEGRLSATVLVPVPLIGPPPSLKRALLSAKPRLTSAGSQEPGLLTIGLVRQPNGTSLVKDA